MEAKRYLKVFNSQEEYEAQKDEVMDMPHVILLEDAKSMMYVKETQEEEKDYSKEYFTIEALEDGLTVSLTQNASQYRIDDSEWVTLESDTETPSINNGQKISFKITNPTISRSGIGTFTVNKVFNAEGNIMSLIYDDDFEGRTDLSGKDNTFKWLFCNCTTLKNAESLILPATTLASDCYCEMFQSCTSLTTAPELPSTTLTDNCYSYMFQGCTSLTTASELPATTLANGCYQGMFDCCTSLTTVPALPVTILAEDCYSDMFHSCVNLTEVPELPATTLAKGCYWGMFCDCTSLTTAPELPATTLAEHCYEFMFNSCVNLTEAPELFAMTLVDYCYSDMFGCCTNLNYIKMLATDISASGCLSNWVEGVSNAGVFVKAQGAEIPSGTSGIPSGWTVENI